ncbi:MAG: YicC/YloC family endoribonuclease, partial [Pseudomonadales bacterium]
MPDSASNNTLHSMTAFARHQGDAQHGAFAWELRSVNHRYLETQFKLPEAFRPLEPLLREKLRATLARGKVDVHLNFSAGEREAGYEVNVTKLEALQQAAAQVAATVGIEARLGLRELLQWPGVLRQPELDFDEVAAELLGGFEKALAGLVRARKLEGDKLAELVQQRLAQILQYVAQVRGRMPDVLAEHRTRIEQRLAELQVEVDADRLTQEIVLLAQKVDVAEELDRLEAHVVEVQRSLGSGEPCGRRLDFLMQELNREANTLASKSIVVDVSQAAVELKVLIEQMREQ